MFRGLAENSIETLWSSDLDFNLNYLSPSTINLFGFTREERLKMNLITLLSESSIQRIKKEIQYKLDHFNKFGVVGDSVILELDGKHRNGTKVWIEVTANITLGSNGKPDGIQGTSRNITPRKTSEMGMLELVENLTVNDELLKAKKQGASTDPI